MGSKGILNGDKVAVILVVCFGLNLVSTPLDLTSTPF